MIYSHPLSVQQQEKSQYNYHVFSLINGFSYMCLGETVLILLAVRIQSPDYIVSALGAMAYFGFLLLPLGKVVTARIGAAQSQATFWVYRNIAALLVASSVGLAYFNCHTLAMVALLTGAFFFYGFRAAGVVMSQPLIGDITTPQTCAKLISVNCGIFYFSGLLTLLAISWLMQVFSNIWMLTGIVIVGSMLGVTASRFIRKIDETEALRQSARQPILADLRKAWQNRLFRRLMLAEFMANFAIILLVPVSMLTIKRGYGISDAQALIFALLQFGASCAISFVMPKLIDIFGTRRILIASYILMLLGAFWWLVAPKQINWWHTGALFVLLGSTNVLCGNSFPSYFLRIVEVRYRVSSSIFRAVLTSAGAGIIGMLISGVLLKLGHAITPGDLMRYQSYFGLVLLLLTPGLWPILHLTVLPMERKIHWPGAKISF